MVTIQVATQTGGRFKFLPTLETLIKALVDINSINIYLIYFDNNDLTMATIKNPLQRTYIKGKGIASVMHHSGPKTRVGNSPGECSDQALLVKIFSVLVTH